MFIVKCLKLRYSAPAVRLICTNSVNTKAFSNKQSIVNRCLEFLFKKNLHLTNSLTSGIFMALGDMIHQEYQYQRQVIKKRYEWDRMGRMFIVGACLGLAHHYYYLYLDIFIPKISVKTVLQKVALDQFFCAPLTIFSFFYIMGTLEGKNLEESSQELHKKFWMVYTGDWMFWPPVQCINFYFIPSRYRVFYINAATMIFDVYLSLMKHYDQKHDA